MQMPADRGLEVRGTMSSTAVSHFGAGRSSRPDSRRINPRRSFSPHAGKAAARETYAMRLDSPEARSLGLPRCGAVCDLPGGRNGDPAEGRPECPRASQRSTCPRSPRWRSRQGAPRRFALGRLVAVWKRPCGGARGQRTTRLEFPVGSVVYEPAFWIGFPRVSPGGDLLAFIDYVRFGQISGSVVLIDRRGRVERLTGVWGEARRTGLVADGRRSLGFTASNTGAWPWRSTPSTSKSANASRGKSRAGSNCTTSQALEVFYLSHEVTRHGILGRVAGQQRESELSWFDYASGPHLSADGTAVLFSEEGEGAGPLLSTYLRPTDGSPAIRLGDGEALALSPDGKWALSMPSFT